MREELRVNKFAVSRRELRPGVDARRQSWRMEIIQMSAMVGVRRLSLVHALHPCGDIIMLRWAILFLVIAIIAAVFGFVGVAGIAMDAAKIVFFVFLVLFVVALIMGKRPPPAG
jgi:uncharacterized membrane protein YtjA (UPF0391 family)